MSQFTPNLNIKKSHPLSPLVRFNYISPRDPNIKTFVQNDSARFKLRKYSQNLTNMSLRNQKENIPFFNETQKDPNIRKRTRAPMIFSMMLQTNNEHHIQAQPLSNRTLGLSRNRQLNPFQKIKVGSQYAVNKSFQTYQQKSVNTQESSKNIKSDFIKKQTETWLKTQLFSKADIEDFKIKQLLGKGSLGKVYLAMHKQTGYHFAIKKIKKKQVTDMSQLVFSIKCHFLSKNPHIIKLFTFFSDEDNIYLLTQLCVDQHLGKYRKKLKSYKQKINVIGGVALAIQDLHQKSLRHGDLKLQNILMSFNFAKINDFDCITRITSQNQSQKRELLWGSLPYFSPQMMIDRTFRLQDDIWSLGIIAYEVFNQKHPFEIRSNEDLQNILEKQMRPLDTQIDQRARNLIKFILQKDVQKRIKIDQILTLCQS